MKAKHLLVKVSTIVGMVLGGIINAQNDLVVFSDNGEKFYLYVNGVKQNSTPETNVRVTNIKHSQVRLKVVFEDNKKIPDLTTNAILMWEGEDKKGWEFVYQIVNKAGKYKIKHYTASEIHRDNSGEQTVVNYTSEEPTPNVTISAPENTNVSLNTQTVTSTTVVTTNSGAQSPNSNSTAGVNISFSPTGVGIHIKDDDLVQNSSTSSSYTTSVVSTTVVSSSSSAASPVTTNPKPSPVSPKPKTVVKCAVSDSEFESIKKSINSKSFEDSKLTMAKQISDSKCLKSSQVRDIMKLFSFEQTRLEFAKYAYKNVIDKDNYYQVNDAFQFENSIEELNESIGK
ncbi:MAG: hypothetical protein KatS3mg027_1464 [Bacteroidia bacterium]|nr:MAG: hypothetical protein KatS3mg027_1464 [Bacteroidia bacterium]